LGIFECNDGIVVDESCVTRILVFFSMWPTVLYGSWSGKGYASRIESVQTAVDQAKTMLLVLLALFYLKAVALGFLVSAT